MKYGVQLHPLGQFPDIAAIVATTRLIEELGFDFVSLPEHTLFPAAMEPMLTRIWYEPLTLISHLAAHTRRLHFYTAATVVTQHNPIHLAKQAATLDVISAGRVGLCVAGGWLEQEISWLGGDPRTRGRTVEEYIALMRALWRDDPATFAGTRYRFEGASFHPKPAGGTVPLFVGGTAAVSAPRAARLGDGWMPTSGFEELKTGLVLLDEALAAEGRGRDGFAIFAELPLFDQAPGVREYLEKINARLPESFGGDLGLARERDRELAALGVTHATLFPAFPEVKRLHRELEAFARAFIP